MTDNDSIWSALKEQKTEKFKTDCARFLADAVSKDKGEWTKHTQWHWSRMIDGNRLDYWPSRKKFQWRGEVKRGLKSMYQLIDKPKEQP